MRPTLAAPKRALQTARQLQLVVLAAAAGIQSQRICAGRQRHTSTHHRASCGAGQQRRACSLASLAPYTPKTHAPPHLVKLKPLDPRIFETRVHKSHTMDKILHDLIYLNYGILWYYTTVYLGHAEFCPSTVPTNIAEGAPQPLLAVPS